MKEILLAISVILAAVALVLTFFVVLFLFGWVADQVFTAMDRVLPIN